MNFTIIIPTYKRESILKETIRQARLAISNYEAELIIVNDAEEKINLSPDELYPAKVIKNPGKGVASARNLGAKMARSDWLIFMDDDIIINKENIYNAIRLMDEYRDESACFNLNWIYPKELIQEINKTTFGRFLQHHGFTSLEGSGWLNYSFKERNTLQPIRSPASFFLIIKKSLLNMVGGYTESFSHSGFEDYDFAMKLNNNKIQAYLYPSSFVLHNEADRIDMERWMARKLRAGITRKHAVELGYLNLALSENGFHYHTYNLIGKYKKVLFTLLKIIPNHKYFDFISFKIINLILGISIHQGYHHNLYDQN